MSSARDAFTAAFPAIAASFVEECSVAHEMPAAATDWIAKMLDYTCVGGKMSRALLVVSTLNRLNSSSEDTPLSAALLEDAHAVGWCIELLQAVLVQASRGWADCRERRVPLKVMPLPHAAAALSGAARDARGAD